MSKKLEINIDFLINFKSKDTLKAEDFKKSKTVFSIFDTNKDGEIDKKELDNIFEQLFEYADINRKDTRENAYAIFDKTEAEYFIKDKKNKDGISYSQLGITVSELFKFLKTLSDKAEPEEIQEENNIDKSSTGFEGKLELTDEQKKIAEELANIPERKEQQFSEEDCKLLASLTPEELNKAKKYFYIEGRKSQFTGNDIFSAFYNIEDKFSIKPDILSRFSALAYLQDKDGRELSLCNIMEILSCNSNEGIDKAIALLNQPERKLNQDTVEEINFILKSGSSYLFNFALNHPNIRFKKLEHIANINRDISEVKTDGKILRFISGMELPEEVTYKQNGNDLVQTLYNPNLNQIQVLTYSNTDKIDKNPSKIETRHLDKGGNIEYTEFYEDGDIPGTKSIYIVDKNNNRTDLQTSKVDPKTGIQTITKNYTDTNRTSTQFRLVANPNNNEYELNYTISDLKGTEPKTLYKNQQSLKQVDKNTFVYTKNGRTYNISITKEKENDNGIMQITDNLHNETYNIDLNKLFQNEQDKIMVDRFIRMPAEMLIFLSEHPLDNINYGQYNKDNNGHFDAAKNLIELGNAATASETELKDTLFSVLMHEFGHFLDYNIGNIINSISTNKEFQDIFQEEVNNFKQKHTSEEQNFAGYFTGATTMEGISRGQQEIVAETNMLTNTVSKEVTSLRAYLIQRYFPKTIAFLAQMTEENLQNYIKK